MAEGGDDTPFMSPPESPPPGDEEDEEVIEIMDKVEADTEESQDHEEEEEENTVMVRLPDNITGEVPSPDATLTLDNIRNAMRYVAGAVDALVLKIHGPEVAGPRQVLPVFTLSQRGRIPPTADNPQRGPVSVNVPLQVNPGGNTLAQTAGVGTLV